MPTSDSDNNDLIPSPEFVAKATSELNNLLQIIAGSSSALEKTAGSDQHSAEYLEMLRASVGRAELLGEELARRSGGTQEKAICPSDAAAASFRKQKKTSKKTSAKQSILVVDDEKMALTLIGRLLREADYDVVTVESGFEAVDQMRREPLRFSLVLLDFSLPFMDGEETFRRLREIRDSIPVVLCTGFILQERLTKMMGSGLTGFLRKPVPPDELLSVVRTTLQSAFYGQPGGGASLVG